MHFRGGIHRSFEGPMGKINGVVLDPRSTDTGSLVTRMGFPTSKGIPQQMQESRGACFKALLIVSEIHAFSKAENVMLPFRFRAEKREEQGFYGLSKCIVYIISTFEMIKFIQIL